ncbi:spore germination protein KA [Paenibacillus phyllosphaerae]|uniref:Spore germination protein KA n=1 Tax=Paenibacillus phyllosphaerae TaxID=274593 RepID=A0A7W5B189_9BACL|nr:spore germination protein [Paenibacillus phyllosphaerae]MBB3112537.1 spore germination protein KA [Paenibacillus phyllosphaerae]
MSFFRSILHRSQTSDLANTAAPAEIEEPGIGASLHDRTAWIHAKMQPAFDLIIHEFQAAGGLPCAVVYIASMIDLETLQDNILHALTAPGSASSREELVRQVFETRQLSVAACAIDTRLSSALNAVLEGNIVLLIDEEPRIAMYPLASFEKRQVSESKNEGVIRGPREAFVEDVGTNITMIRRRVKRSELKLLQLHVGEYTKTDVVVFYIEGLCKPELVEEVRSRIENIRIDSIIGSSYLEECIEDNPLSVFPQMQNTERVDTASSALLEGRVIIMTNGTPIALIAPATFFVFIQSAEDYYERTFTSSWIRWIRFLYLILAVLLPSIYIALTTFHPEMIPTSLLISLAAAREGVPFPAIVEALIMEITFEALREASIRIPSSIGQAVSILGALVIGEAAVKAGIVSAPMVIVVALSGISSYIVPNFSMGLSLRLLRFPIMFLAANFGVIGIGAGITIIMLHMVSLRSFGIPYFAPIAPLSMNEMKDVFWRSSRRYMEERPTLFGAAPGKRMSYRRSPRNEEDSD